MAEGTFNLDSAGVEISKVRTVGEVRRPQLESKNRYKNANQYDKTSPDIFSEGLNGSIGDRGKEPQTPPASVVEAYKTIGGKEDITARISNSSPGSLTKNTYMAGGKEYDNVI
jgi:hypothetical protein